MYETDDIILLQMQKTGSTHAGRVLAKYLGSGTDNEEIGKHRPASQEQIESGKLIVSSIRNPWDWYVSLWTFGTEGKGGLRHRLCNPSLQQQPTAIQQSQSSEQSKSQPAQIIPRHSTFQTTPIEAIDAHQWGKLYQDKSCLASFRQWLQHVHNPVNASQLGEGYAASGLAEICGFMTYRYLRLCCGASERTNAVKSIQCAEDLPAFDRGNCYVNHFIRQENLNQDLCDIIAKLRRLSDSEQEQIRHSNRTNSSDRLFPVAAYYDESSSQLIYQREQLLISKFGYEAPGQASEAIA